ncbi:MAG: sulfite exporter TauE/SafE family protein [Methanoregula sp.]|nr:sulfite exporter TauE/SafE family protein [Methanoregula sp.]
MFDTLAAFVIASVIGLVASVIGLGGGFLYVPTLTLMFGLDQKTTVGTSLAVMIFSSFFATLVYVRQKRVLGSLALLVVLPAMVFSLIGSWLTTVTDSHILVLLFVLVLILMSLQMLVPSLNILPVLRIGPEVTVTVPSACGSGTTVRIPYLHLAAWGALGGLVSGVTGVSGGAFFVPALVVSGVPLHLAVATSLLAIIPISMTGAAVHATLGQVSLPYLAVYGAGAGIGAFTGASLAPRIPANRIRQVFGVLLIVIAIIMIQQKVLGS